VTPKKRSINPFYPLLVLVGLAFAITACGFAVMMVSDSRSTGEFEAAGASGFIQFFHEYGFAALMIELSVLALATFGAMATDKMWTDRVDPAPTKGQERVPPPPDK